MAADHNHSHEVSAMDYVEHDRTFSLFADLIKWGTVVSLGFLLLAGAATGLISWLFAIAVTVIGTAVTAKFF